MLGVEILSLAAHGMLALLVVAGFLCLGRSLEKLIPVKKICFSRLGACAYLAMVFFGYLVWLEPSRRLLGLHGLLALAAGGLLGLLSHRMALVSHRTWQVMVYGLGVLLAYQNLWMWATWHFVVSARKALLVFVVLVALHGGVWRGMRRFLSPLVFRLAHGIFLFALYFLPLFLPARPVAELLPTRNHPALRPPASTHNVLLITVDTLRADAVGVYGWHSDTPNMDRLGREGTWFTDAQAPSCHTLPSMTAMFSCLHPSVLAHGRHSYAVPGEEWTLAEKLRSVGYTTAAFVGNQILGVSSGMLQGFDEASIWPVSYQTAAFSYLPVLGSAYHEAAERLGFMGRHPDLTQRVTEHALGFLADHQDEPFFLWLHYFDPHAPYTPPAPFHPGTPPAGRLQEDWDEYAHTFPHLYQQSFPELLARLKALYRGEVRYVDEKIGEILKALDSAGLSEKTLVVLTSDHGEEFYEHQGYLHGHSFYEELVRVPLILRGPGIPRGKRVAAVVQLMGVIPVLEEALGLDPHPFPRQGESFWPLVQPGDAEGDDVAWQEEAFSEGNVYRRPARMFRVANWKLIEKTFSGDHELYDIMNDPSEIQNLAACRADIVARLQERLSQTQARNEALRGTFPTEPKEHLEEDVRYHLQALGYVL
ncbi:MAG: sulfatase [Acidobacteriota bacterium]|nr:MAG: sulfatase [Acidobacteriota bacterium]